MLNFIFIINNTSYSFKKEISFNQFIGIIIYKAKKRRCKEGRRRKRRKMSK